jgi:H+-transporting ATPase
MDKSQTHSPIHDSNQPKRSSYKPPNYEIDPKERQGLTNEQAEVLYQQWGYNELPAIEIPLWWVFLEQFMGTMPYMLELAIIIAAAVSDWLDFGIIFAMVSRSIN